MAQLEIYDSEGNGLYPDDVESSGHMSRYFDQHALAADITEENPTIEAYFRVERLGRPEQVSLRYTGDDPSTVFADCRRAIEQELIDGQGWTVLQPSGANPADAVFWNGIWKSSAATSSGDFLNHISIGLDPDEIELMQYIADEDDNQPLRFSVNRYQTVGSQLSRLLEIGRSFSVSRPLQSPIPGVDLQFTIKRSQTSDFELHPDSKQLLRKKKQERKEQIKKKELTSIDETIARLNQLGAKDSEMKKTLNSSLDQTFSNLTVRDRQEIKDLKTKANQKKNPNQSQSTRTRGNNLSSGTRGPYNQSLFFESTIIKVLIVTLVIAIIVFLMAIIINDLFGLPEFSSFNLAVSLA